MIGTISEEICRARDDLQRCAPHFEAALERFALRLQENWRADSERLRATLKPFAEVPPHSPPDRRCLVADAGAGPYHFLQSDLDRAKEVYRGNEQAAPQNTSAPQT